MVYCKNLLSPPGIIEKAGALARSLAFELVVTVPLEACLAAVTHGCCPVPFAPLPLAGGRLYINAVNKSPATNKLAVVKADFLNQSLLVALYSVICCKAIKYNFYRLLLYWCFS
jgi:hypothetical protein